MAEQLLVWMDLEMTGLDPEKERIIEMATIITDGDLNVVASGPEMVVHQPEDVLSKMDDWNKEHHGKSGLIDRVRASTIDEQKAQADTLAFIQAYCGPKSTPLAGSSIHQDRRFLQKYMPDLDNYLHYRNVDVSTVKELLKRWLPEVTNACPPKKSTHRALEDIQDSINELKFYRSLAIRTQAEVLAAKQAANGATAAANGSNG